MMEEPDDHMTSSQALPTKPGVRQRFRRGPLVALVWVVVCSGLLTSCGVMVQRAREATRCTTCEFNLKVLWLGLGGFNNANGSLPPAWLCDENGKPMHSWRALMFPYAGYYGFTEGYHIKEPWDGPTNAKWQKTPFYELQCRSVDAKSHSAIDYVAVVGPDTMWPGRERVKLLEKVEGGQDTILVIEMPDSDYRALEPRSPTVDEFMAKIKSPTGKGIRTIHPKGLAYVTVGGDVRWFPPGTEPETIRQLLKRDPKCKVIPAEEKIGIVENWEKIKDER
jgi:hypothetical protein